MPLAIKMVEMMCIHCLDSADLKLSISDDKLLLLKLMFGQRRYDTRHEMLTQRALFCIGVNAKRCKKGLLGQHYMMHVVPPPGSHFGHTLGHSMHMPSKAIDQCVAVLWLPCPDHTLLVQQA